MMNDKIKMDQLVTMSIFDSIGLFYPYLRNQ